MMLLVAQSPGQDGVLQVHRPEFCYPAGGYRMSGSRVHTIDLPDNQRVPTRFFTATSPERTEQMIYWTRIGRDMPTTWVQQRLSVAEANLRGEIPDAVMVRISVATSDPAAISQIDEFAHLLIAGLPPKSRPVLIGTPNA
jgi:EpsI family protein